MNGKIKAVKSNYRLKFFLQTYVLSSNIKILEEEMNLRGKKVDKPLLDEFLDNLIENLDLERVSLNLSNDPNTAKKAFELLVAPQNIVNLLAYKTTKAKEGETKEQYYLRCLDKEILFSHKGNNAFFDKVSYGLAKRLKIQRSFINENKQETKEVLDEYDFLDDNEEVDFN